MSCAVCLSDITDPVPCSAGCSAELCSSCTTAMITSDGGGYRNNSGRWRCPVCRRPSAVDISKPPIAQEDAVQVLNVALEQTQRGTHLELLHHLAVSASRDLTLVNDELAELCERWEASLPHGHAVSPYDAALQRVAALEDLLAEMDAERQAALERAGAWPRRA